MIGLDAGAAWLPRPGRVRVRAVFSRAIHGTTDDGRLLVVVGSDEPSGPLHLRVDRLVPVAEGGWLHVGATGLDLRGAVAWQPPPLRGTPRPGRLPGATRSALAGAGELMAAVRARLAEDDVAAAAGLLGGLGPGLTPAGDDVLAGILLTRHACGDGPDRLRAAAGSVRSTDLSLAYLHWAAAGQCIAPAHDVLTALTIGDADQVLAASASLCRHGASSGADLLLGIEAAVATWRPGGLGGSPGGAAAGALLRTGGGRARPP